MFSRRSATILWILMVFSVASSGACSEPGSGGSGETAVYKKMRDLIKSLDTSIYFYGRVLDQHDQPVVDARVVVDVSFFDPSSEFFVGVKPHMLKTDLSGRFAMNNIRGSEISIEGISAQGYEYLRRMNPKYSFKYTIPPEEYGEAFIPDKNNPVIFRLRKKLMDRTFLLEDDWGIQVKEKESGKMKGSDYIEGKKTQMPGDKPKDFLSPNCDLFYRATYEEKTGKWHVLLRSAGPEGGILLSDKKLYVAPDSGFEKEWSLVPKDTVIPEKRFIYLRSRSPAIYSRLEMIYVIANDKFLTLAGKRVTNPYGDRVLDSVDMDSLTNHQHFVLEKRLKSEAKTALREGRLPPRPKIMALIEEAKRTVPLEASARREPSQKDH